MNINSFQYLGFCLEGLFFGTISFHSCKFLKRSDVTLIIISGIYSGIFAMYLHYHASQKNIDKAKNILFYALCVLYTLSTAAIIIIIWGYCISDLVSRGDPCLTFNSQRANQFCRT